MSNLMLDVDQAGELKAAFRRGGWTNAQIKCLCEGDFLSQVRKVVLGEAEVKAIFLLTEVATVEVPAVERFVASERFGPNNPDGIKFYLGSNFENYFLGKIEENVPAVTLAIHRLNRSSVDEPIRQELTPEREETALAHFYELIKNQPRGEHGKLPTDGTLIIAYIKDAKGNLWAVRADRLSIYREWYMSARSVGNPNEWPAGDLVVSRK